MFCESLNNILNFRDIEPLIGNKVKIKNASDCGAISLTFDDGPTPHTISILRYLKKVDVKATFFVLAEQITKHPEIARKIANEGHQVAVHGLKHIDVSKLNNYQLIDSLKQFERIANKLNIRFEKLFRPPYGEIRKDQVEAAKTLGYSTVLWSRDSFDWKYNSTQTNNRFKQTSLDNDIVLFHDGMLSGSRFSTLRSVVKLIRMCQDKGISILPLNV